MIAEIDEAMMAMKERGAPIRVRLDTTLTKLEIEEL